ncbi:MAG TPA: Gx transporter family protein [Bacilli bacterium]|nr:Gx transporter family protein [Bacilli bacterium]
MVTGNKKIQTMILLAILVALATILSYIDGLISRIAFSFLPTAKIGLANIVILFAIYRLDFKKTLVIVILKSFLVGLILGSPITFIISICATLVSFLGMYLLKKGLSEKVTAVGISVVGGTLHIITQLIVVAFIYKLGEIVISYGAILFVGSLITSIIIGLLTNKLVQHIKVE